MPLILVEGERHCFRKTKLPGGTLWDGEGLEVDAKEKVKGTSAGK